MATIDPAGPRRAATYDTGTPDRLLDTTFAFWRSALLLHAHALGIFATLAHGAGDVAAVSKRLGLRHETTGELFEVLETLGFLERQGDCYRNAADVDRFLDPEKSAYIGRWLTMAHATLADLPDLAAHLKVSDAEGQDTSLADRMWADIAGILAATSLNEGV